MAIQILPGQSRTAGLGQAMGTGLGQGLQLLLQDKMSKILQRRQQEKTTTGLEALGIPQQEASQISMLPKELQAVVVKNYLAGAESAGIEQALSGITGEPVPSPTGLQALGLQTGATEEVGMPRKTLTQEQTKVQQALRSPRLTTEQKMKIEQLRIKKEAQRFKERHVATEQEAKAWDKADPFIKEVDEKSHAAKVNNMDINRLAELEGGLDTPAYIELLKESGFDIPALKSPESQEFEKIRQTFMRDIKKYLGARISNFELEQFLKTIPDLSQSPAGRRRVIANIKRINNISMQYGKSLDKVIERHGGVPPRDLRRKVDRDLDKRLDVVAKQFKKDMQRTIPKWSKTDTVATAIGSLTGKVIGAVTGLAKLPLKIGSMFSGGH